MAKTKKKKKAAASKKPIKKAVRKVVKKPVKKVIKKKAPAKKSALKKTALKKTKKALKPEKGFLGEITHYFPKVRAAVIKLKEPLGIGDRIKIKGHTTDFIQTVKSLQIDRVDINSAQKGDEIGFQVESRVRRGDKVTKL
jgi:hypothetical protein